MATAKKGKRKPAKKKAPKKKPAMSAQDFLEGIEADEDDEFSFYSDQMLAGDGDVARMGTGILAVDRLTGGGWPIGRMTELAAWEGIGKSTLIDQSIAETQRNGGRAALIDTENARDLSYMATLGVDSRASTIEGCFKAIDRLLDRREQELATHDLKPMLIVWDSIGGTPTQKELDGGPEDGHMMGAARVLKLNMRRVHWRLERLRVALVCTNHYYKTIGPFASLKTYGGSAILYFATFRVWLSNKGQLKIGTQVVGHQVEVKLKKTRLGPPRTPEIAGLIHGRGFDNSFSLFEWARTHGAAAGHTYVAQRGAWYTLSMVPDDPEPTTFQRGFAGFGELLQTRSEVYAELVKRYRET